MRGISVGGIYSYGRKLILEITKPSRREKKYEKGFEDFYSGVKGRLKVKSSRKNPKTKQKSCTEHTFRPATLLMCRYQRSKTVLRSEQRKPLPCRVQPQTRLPLCEWRIFLAVRKIHAWKSNKFLLTETV